MAIRANTQRGVNGAAPPGRGLVVNSAVAKAGGGDGTSASAGCNNNNPPSPPEQHVDADTELVTTTPEDANATNELAISNSGDQRVGAEAAGQMDVDSSVEGSEARLRRLFSTFTSSNDRVNFSGNPQVIGMEGLTLEPRDNSTVRGDSASPSNNIEDVDGEDTDSDRTNAPVASTSPLPSEYRADTSEQKPIDREAEVILEPVKEELEKLGQPLPPAELQLKMKPGMQIIKERLLPIGEFIVRYVGSLEDKDRGRMELKLCQYIADHHWPIHSPPLEPHLHIQEIYRNMIFKRIVNGSHGTVNEALHLFADEEKDAPSSSPLPLRNRTESASASASMHEQGNEAGNTTTGSVRTTEAMLAELFARLQKPNTHGHFS
ncbi:unnamed protein product [Periconia digitata]|uniref:Chromodomain-helicase-DNA-binding protein 1-like C-terminal domain-containing protein n=1 Tax=Periconia digitata TaxID=1303443 RepID=A0A9W4XNA3_9PLEO|nr:unnamed protein product [Periconia digitata]